MDDLIAFLANNPGWSWMIVGAILFALDVMAPGFFLLWFGAAAAVVGLIVFAIPIGFTWQILVFCGVSVLSVLLGRALWGSNRGAESDKPLPCPTCRRPSSSTSRSKTERTASTS